MMKPNRDRARILLMVTLALPLAIMSLAFLSLFTGSADAALALFLFCTFSLYVTFAAGLLVPVWIAIVSLFGRGVERRRIRTLLLLSALNIAVAVICFFWFVTRLQFRW